MMATAAAVAFVVISCKGKLGEAAALDLNDMKVIPQYYFCVLTVVLALRPAHETV